MWKWCARWDTSSLFGFYSKHSLSLCLYLFLSSSLSLSHWFSHGSYYCCYFYPQFSRTTICAARTMLVSSFFPILASTAIPSSSASPSPSPDDYLFLLFRSISPLALSLSLCRPFDFQRNVSVHVSYTLHTLARVCVYTRTRKRARETTREREANVLRGNCISKNDDAHEMSQYFVVSTTYSRTFPIP